MVFVLNPGIASNWTEGCIQCALVYLAIRILWLNNSIRTIDLRQLTIAEFNQSGILVTASPPGENGVGCNYLRDILPFLSFEQILCCPVLADVQQAVLAPDRKLSQGPVVRLRFESAWRYGPPVLKDLLALGGFLAKTKPWAARVAKRLLNEPGVRESDHLVIVLESPQLILMADSLHQHFQGRMTVIVWDHVDHVLQRFGHQSIPLKMLRAAFSRVVQNSVSTISVSKALAERLQTINPDACHAVVPAPVLSHAESRPRTAEQRFVIGFAGSVTAPRELEGLQLALDSVGWRIDGTEIVLRLTGPRFLLSARTQRRIEYLGFLPTSAEAINVLSECDACFLPQPFSPQETLLARYSFPTKLSTYLAAGRPVIVHAPAYASIPSAFPASSVSGDCAVGLVSTDPDPLSLVECLKQLIQSSKRYEQCVERVALTRAGYFGAEQCRAELKRAFPVNATKADCPARPTKT